MSEGISLVASARIQRRIVGALLLRELLTRFGRHNIGFLWLFAEPMLFTLGVLGIWTLYHTNRTPFPLTAFCLSGYATVLLWRNTIGRCGNAVEPNRALMHHRNVKVIDLFLARIVLEISGASVSFVVLLVIFMLMGAIAPPDDVIKMIVAWGMLAWFSASMALIVGPLATLSEPFERFWHVFAYLFLPASGAFFAVAMLSPHLQSIALWVPTVSCAELLREGLFGPSIGARYDLYYVAVVNLALMIPGLLLTRHIQVTVEGE
jgi:capsular polysaccharide transport system permease protein